MLDLRNFVERILCYTKDSKKAVLFVWGKGCEKKGGGKEKLHMAVLKTINLKKYYGVGENQVKALDDVNLEIERGEFVAIVGSSGSGGHVKIRLS